MKSLIAVAALGITLSMASAQSRQSPEVKWVSLFNGHDLTGWTKIGKESWTVQNGVIHGQAVTKAYGYLETAKTYKNFQLSLEFKCEGTGNSGVFFHTDFKPGTVDVTPESMQFEVDCTIGRHTGGVYAEDGRYWIVWPAAENATVVRKGEWNTYLVQVNGNRYRSRLNGIQMIDFTDPKPKQPADGHIALQLHAGGEGNMEFRDIMIRDLSNR
jgi:hypothetical protein